MPRDDFNQLDLIHRAIEAYCESKFKFTFDPKNPIVRLHEPSYGSEEILAVLDVLLSTFVTQGPLVREFERKFSETVRNRYSVSCNSGSSANLLAISALKALGDLKPGDEVIVPALSWPTTIWPIVQNGLIPVLVDVDLDTFNLDPKEVEKAITSKTRAIMLIHLYGNPCDMTSLARIGQKHNLLLIEDCCEAMGAYYMEYYPVGTFGDVSTFSFYYSHHITTIEGGMVITPHRDIDEMLRIQRSHGWIREIEDRERWCTKYPQMDPKFLFVDLGYNFRMSDPNAAIGIVQLKKLKDFVAIRRENNKVYETELEGLKVFDFQLENPGSSAFGFNILLNNRANFTVGEIRAFLKARDIETRPIVAGNMALQPAMKKVEYRVSGELKNTTKIMTSGFAIGNHHLVNAEATDYVISTIGEFVCAHS